MSLNLIGTLMIIICMYHRLRSCRLSSHQTVIISVNHCWVQLSAELVIAKVCLYLIVSQGLCDWELWWLITIRLGSGLAGSVQSNLAGMGHTLCAAGLRPLFWYHLKDAPGKLWGRRMETHCPYGQGCLVGLSMMQLGIWHCLVWPLQDLAGLSQNKTEPHFIWPWNNVWCKRLTGSGIE